VPPARCRSASDGGHPFFLATLFQPELDDGTRPHSVITALARAAVKRSRGALI
jgi:CTP synthase (UTP-ammonia lyase)